jgi:hypothetical protein
MARSEAPTGRQAARLVSAAVWLHQGLWCKVLGRDARHLQVVAGLPGTTERRARALTTAIGLGETALAATVVVRGDRRWLAALQTGLVGLFNLGGLTVGRRHITHPSRLLVRNGLLVALFWSAVDGRHRDARR